MMLQKPLFMSIAVGASLLAAAALPPLYAWWSGDAHPAPAIAPTPPAAATATHMTSAPTAAIPAPAPTATTPATPSAVAATPSPSVPAPIPITVAALVREEIAFVAPDGSLSIGNAGTAQVRRVTGGPVSAPVWSHDGTRLAYLREGNLGGDRIETVNADTHERKTAAAPQLLTGSIDGASAYASFADLRWSFDGASLFYRHFGGCRTCRTIHSMNLVTRQEQTRQIFAGEYDVSRTGAIVTASYAPGPGYALRLTPPGATNEGERLVPSPTITWRHPVFSPDGTRIAAAGAPGLWVFETSGAAPVQIASEGGALAPAWSPDGALLAFAAGAEGIRIVTPAGENRLAAPLAGRADHLTWSPDGQHLAFARDGAVWRLTLADQTVARLFPGTAPQWRPSAAPASPAPLPSAPPLPACPPERAALAYAADDEGAADIFVTDLAATCRTRLTDHRGEHHRPAWSPDGARLAFSSDSDGVWDIFVMNADGSQTANLTHDGHFDWDPAWSPDGKSIAFGSNRTRSAIASVPPDGGPITLLVSEGVGWLRAPSWSPTGSLAASDNCQLIAGTPAKSLPRLAEGRRECQWAPAWSPDGKKIAYVGRTNAEQRIMVMNADGSGAAALTVGGGEDGDPTWSPDGNRLAFVSWRDGLFGLYVMNADGSGVARVLSSPVWLGQPAWRPAPRR